MRARHISSLCAAGAYLNKDVDIDCGDTDFQLVSGGSLGGMNKLIGV